jgi:bifunctional non-homologous end joining protein LigD/DNA ligase-1
VRDWLEAKIRPMLAGTSEPFDSPEYLYEVKWDGIRALAFFGPGVARLQGRRFFDGSEKYPEIVAALRKLEGEGVLDGEIVVLDDEGRPNFQRVLMREQTHSREDALLKAPKHPVVYVAFDLLFRDGEPLFQKPLVERRRLLSELLRNAPSPIVESTYVVGRGRAFFREAEARRLEGVVAKRLQSRYLPGERTRDWLKLKVRRVADCVLVGMVRDRALGRVKSLVLGGLKEGSLVWVGNVGSGLDQSTLAQLNTELSALRGERPEAFEVVAPGDIEWLVPRLVVRVEYTELTRERRLRQPVFVGFVDKRPEDCAAPSF